jgi:hypothetical protein
VQREIVGFMGWQRGVRVLACHARAITPRRQPSTFHLLHRSILIE